MNPTKIIFFLKVLLTCPAFSGGALAYEQDHPPYTFKEGPYRALEAQPVWSFGQEEYRSPDGTVLIRVKGSMDKPWDLLIQEGGKTIVKRHIAYAPVPTEIYHVDVNGDRQKDFVLLMTYFANGISFLHERVEIYLKKTDGAYSSIAYDGVAVSLKDFVDMDRNGKYELIITGFYGSGQHSYFSYSVYAFQSFKLVNVDKKYPGFPKFVQFLERPHDKDATEVSQKERARHIKEIDANIRYKQ